MIVELSEDGSEEVFEVSDDGWFDFDVAGFVGVDFLHDLHGVFFCDGLEFEWRMSGAWWVLGDAFFCFQLDWDGLTGLFSDCDEEVVKFVGNILWVCVGCVFVDHQRWCCSGFALVWYEGIEDLCLFFLISFGIFYLLTIVLFLCSLDGFP